MLSENKSLLVQQWHDQNGSNQLFSNLNLFPKDRNHTIYIIIQQKKSVVKQVMGQRGDSTLLFCLIDIVFLMTSLYQYVFLSYPSHRTYQRSGCLQLVLTKRPKLIKAQRITLLHHKWNIHSNLLSILKGCYGRQTERVSLFNLVFIVLAL